ncbi:MAG: RimK family alpha-L-glutamate ligase [Gemmatimonadota bacterium]
MTPARIGILHGIERQFPPALAERINVLGAGRVVATPVQIGLVRQDELPRYDLILDRISHEVPFYRTWLKAAAVRGTHVVNNPFWWSADDKFVGNLIALDAGVAVPRTVLVPHKHHPPNTRSDSFVNLEAPLDWEAMFAYLGFPIFLKPAYGGGWRDVHRCDFPGAFFEAYDQTRDLLMIAQEGIAFSDYYRCYGLGRERVRLMPYDPSQPFERRYVRDGREIPPERRERLERDCLALCRALGYDFNTLEFAVREDVPYAIDFMNPAPDCDRFSVGDDHFEWVLSNAADLLIERALNPRPLELTGSWPERAERPPTVTESAPRSEIAGPRSRAAPEAGAEPAPAAAEKPATPASRRPRAEPSAGKPPAAKPRRR